LEIQTSLFFSIPFQKLPKILKIVMGVLLIGQDGIGVFSIFRDNEMKPTSKKV
jgi:hypothetical protein